MGTDKLPIPELIPFRLTKNLEKVLKPLDSSNSNSSSSSRNTLYRHYMVKCMIALKDNDNTNTLINELEVYINDPIVDWQKRSLSHMTDDEVASLVSTETWEPRLRINSTINKLKGVNPITIIMSDLARHQSKSMYADRNMLVVMRKVLEESCSSSSGSSSDGKCISISDQIDILIAIATSPSILARQYGGLEPWL